MASRRILQDYCSSPAQFVAASPQNAVAGTQHLHTAALQRRQGLSEQSQQMSLFSLGCCLLLTDFRILLGPQERVEKAGKDRAVLGTDLLLLLSTSLYSAGSQG